MTEKECWEFCKSIIRFGRSLAQHRKKFVISQDIDILRIKKGRYNIQRLFYHNIFKCFYNKDFTFQENNLVNFDWYHPVDAHRHTKDEVYSWFKKAGLININILAPESGISAIGMEK